MVVPAATRLYWATTQWTGVAPVAGYDGKHTINRAEAKDLSNLLLAGQGDDAIGLLGDYLTFQPDRFESAAIKDELAQAHAIASRRVIANELPAAAAIDAALAQRSGTRTTLTPDAFGGRPVTVYVPGSIEALPQKLQVIVRYVSTDELTKLDDVIDDALARRPSIVAFIPLTQAARPTRDAFNAAADIVAALARAYKRPMTLDDTTMIIGGVFDSAPLSEAAQKEVAGLESRMKWPSPPPATGAGGKPTIGSELVGGSIGVGVGLGTAAVGVPLGIAGGIGWAYATAAWTTTLFSVMCGVGIVLLVVGLVIAASGASAVSDGWRRWVFGEG